GIKGKALFLGVPVEGAIHGHRYEPRGSIYSYDFETLKYEWLMEGVNGFDISRDNKMLIYQSHHRLRVLKAGEKPPKPESHEPNRESGWLDLHRVKVSVQPAAEWKQMFNEAWRLQREHFWAEDMARRTSAIASHVLCKGTPRTLIQLHRSPCRALKST